MGQWSMLLQCDILDGPTGKHRDALSRYFYLESKYLLMTMMIMETQHETLLNLNFRKWDCLVVISKTYYLSGIYLCTCFIITLRVILCLFYFVSSFRAWDYYDCGHTFHCCIVVEGIKQFPGRDKTSWPHLLMLTKQRDQAIADPAHDVKGNEFERIA